MAAKGLLKLIFREAIQTSKVKKPSKQIPALNRSVSGWLKYIIKVSVASLETRPNSEVGG
jgi:hypothetical protein